MKEKKLKKPEEIVQKVQKQPEFMEFLELVEEKEIPDTWELLATAIGVHRNTISNWRKTPEFQKALAKGIQKAIRGMEKAGKSDWRMWKCKLEILLREKTQKEDDHSEFSRILEEERKIFNV